MRPGAQIGENMGKPLPIGVDDFAKLRRGNYYYVDKTGFIKELLDIKGEVNLFTRPRRFGKTLNLSMLRYFFEDTGSDRENDSNRALFEGLSIMESGNYYTDQMGKYPVISLSLKSAKQPDWQSSYGKLCRELTGEFSRHRNVMEYLAPEKRSRYEDILKGTADKIDFSDALKFLSEALWDGFRKKTVILIDEYDVPLENAYFSGFYDEMITFIRSLFESALKTNPCLEFAVITGCLRITKESIFTGLNNLKIISVLSDMYDEYFGFTEAEAIKMLTDYGRPEKKGIMKNWYDGYRFGKAEVYNPWSVENYIEAVSKNPDALPAPYWANTSSNNIVRSLVEKADLTVKQEMERLLSGGTIEKLVHEEITYEDIDKSEDNLWNFLFYTGYLRLVYLRLEGRNRYITMAVPNEEVAYIYESTITGWFRDQIKTTDLSEMYHAMLEGKSDIFGKRLSILLMQSISYMDSRENFYHGFLLGVLSNLKDYIVNSNRESGKGRYDICVRSLDVCQLPVILELKVSETYNGLEAACDTALQQIEEKEYGNWLMQEGYTGMLEYGIAFYKKQCRIKVKKKKFVNRNI